jgi:hypothetical protein
MHNQHSSPIFAILPLFCCCRCLQCFINGTVDEAVRDMRVCPELGGEVAFPKGMPPYPFGVDPVWHGTKSELPFLNSMKMKMSILLGVVHMNLGIMMSLFNNLYFKDRLSTICEFIPQVGAATVPLHAWMAHACSPCSIEGRVARHVLQQCVIQGRDVNHLRVHPTGGRRSCHQGPQ